MRLTLVPHSPAQAEMKHSLVSHSLHLNNIVSKTLSYRDPIPTTNHGGCDSLNVKSLMGLHV